MWSNFDGKPYNREQLADHINSLDFSRWLRRDGSRSRPSFITVHNTSSPDLKLWQSWAPSKRQAYIHNVQGYYENMGWRSGPHFFVVPDPDIITFGFSNLMATGVHASCFNRDSIGIEMIGEYNREEFDSGPGAIVQEHVIYLLALLHNRIGIDPSTIHYHIECRHDNHDCPGTKARNKPRLISQVRNMMSVLRYPPDGPPAPIPIPTPTPGPTPIVYEHGSPKWVQNALKELGVDPSIAVDGIIGVRSRLAIRSFQISHGLRADAIAGPMTVAALDIALASAQHPNPSPTPSPNPSPGRRQTNILMTEFAGPSDSANDKINGYTEEQIDWRKPGFALPFHFPKPYPKGVRVFWQNKSVQGPLVDIGPHTANPRVGQDDYWAKGTRPRAEEFTDNKAALDATPAVFDALGIPGKREERSARVDWEFIT